MLSGITLHPVPDVVQYLLASKGIEAELFRGEYNSHVAEAHGSALTEFAPDVVLLVPALDQCRYRGSLLDEASVQQAAVDDQVDSLLVLCRTINARTGATLVLANFPPAIQHDLGAPRNRVIGSDWNFRRLVNLGLGLHAPSFVQICDLEFLATRHGASAYDERGRFEWKQPFSGPMQADVAREIAHIVVSLHAPARKVLVTDLDNTLWGGVIADDGLDGIEVGTTSPRGEAFRAFQEYLQRLSGRGVLLAVASKNSPEIAAEPFRSHPEMVLRWEDFVAFEAGWNPKPQSIERIAAALGLGLDSVVFVDDNPAEIEQMRQFLPMVGTVALGDDPATFVRRLAETRYFESASLTAEDVARVGQYRAEQARTQLRESIGDLDAYLASLEMTATCGPITARDVPRCAQLINKSNQFNLTTRRRSESELLEFVSDPAAFGFWMRLADKYGDNGIIAVVLGTARGGALDIDTWVMSCRVLQRGVEQETLRRIMEIAAARGCGEVRGHYIPTSRNGLVENLYPSLGFGEETATADGVTYRLTMTKFVPPRTHIAMADQPS